MNWDPEQVLDAADKVLENQIVMLEAVKVFDPESDLLIFLRPTEALKHSIPTVRGLSLQIRQLFQGGHISLPDATKALANLVGPFIHILEDYRDRQQRLAGKTNS